LNFKTASTLDISNGSIPLKLRLALDKRQMLLKCYKSDMFFYISAKFRLVFDLYLFTVYDETAENELMGLDED